MAAGPFDFALRHNTWATVSLLEFCGELDPAALDLEAAGTYGTLYGTLQHAVGAEQWYLMLLTGELFGRRLRRDDPRRSTDELIAIVTATGTRALTVAGSDDLDRRIVMGGGERDWSTVGVILAQLVHHGNEHRTHATTILGANGIEPPALSGWGYGRAAGISEAHE